LQRGLQYLDLELLRYGLKQFFLAAEMMIERARRQARWRGGMISQAEGVWLAAAPRTVPSVRCRITAKFVPAGARALSCRGWPCQAPKRVMLRTTFTSWMVAPAFSPPCTA